MIKPAFYNLITPVKNEEEHLPTLARCVVRQSHLPAAWVIVNDASTDRTPDIVGELIARYDWIHTMRISEASERSFGTHFAELVRMGFDRSMALCPDVRYLVKVDADVRFHSHTLRMLCATMDERADLAIASPRLMTLKQEINPEVLLSPDAVLADRKLVIRTDRNRTNEPTDGIRVYRKAFLDDMGGFPVTDASADIILAKAIMGGYGVTFVDEVWGCLTRESGSTLRNDLSRGRIKGYRQYIAHYHPILVMASILWDTFHRPTSALGAVVGYMGSYANRRKRIDDPDVIGYFGRERFREVVNFVRRRFGLQDQQQSVATMTEMRTHRRTVQKTRTGE